MVASTVGDEKAGNDSYQGEHMSLIFREGLSFSGFERDCLFRNAAGEKFEDISGVSGIDSISDGRAAVLADLDNDGDLDIFLTTIQGEGHLLFRSNAGQDHNFIRIALEGTASGRDAFGATVRVKTKQGIQTRVKSGGNGFLAQPGPRLLFGLGTEKQAEWIEVTWPSGRVQRLGPLTAPSSLKLVEGGTELSMVTDQQDRLPDPLDRDQSLWRKLALKKGEEFPRLDLKPVAQGDTRSALETGVPHFLNLWATWCGPCRKEMPELEKLLPQFRAQNVRLVGISLDQDIEPADIMKFAETLGISYPLSVVSQR